MKSSHVTLLILTFSLTLTPESLSAQSTDKEIVVVTLTGQNYNRKVAGVVTTECDDVRRPVQWHDPPWGNWGVDSNYGSRTDTDQFRGWEHKDGPSTKKQWNSCTLGRSEYAPGNCDFYNANDCMTQETEPLTAVVTHGRMSYRAAVTNCPTPGTVGNEPGRGCRALDGTQASQISNYMSLFELDYPDPDDAVERLYFPGTSVTFSGCSYERCPERTTGWVVMTSSSSPTARVEAELRMKAKATLHGFCDWDAGD